MKVPPESQALREVGRRLEELLGAVAASSRSEPLSTAGGPDAVLQVGDRRFLVEWRASGDVASVAAALRNLDASPTRTRRGAVRLLAVPFLGEAGRRICAENGVSWLDLSGNASVDAPGIRVRVEGKENRFKRRGRPSNPFAPRSSRVARRLLIHPDEFQVQGELAAAVGLGAGFVSRIVRRLEELELVERNKVAAVRARDPRVLLQAWSEHYEFESHHVVRGHVSARAGEELLARVSKALSQAGIEHAATGLSAAWLLSRFAAHRTVTYYLDRLPTAEELEDLGFRSNESGSNLWLALPRDEGVFHGARRVDGIPCAHPVQVWLDLQGHPERAREAARQLEPTLFERTKRG